MTLKESLQQDLDAVFFNTDEFAEPHMISGRSVNIVVDNERSEKLASSAAVGVFGSIIVYYAKVTDFDNKPKIGDVQDFDNGYYQVVDVKEDLGVYEIILRGSEV
ncbi:MAG TPA: hypothetical protein VEG39_01760 [Clostridia bacterium]|nr:hypothetical protein [Clostridia bacterium]